MEDTTKFPTYRTDNLALAAWLDARGFDCPGVADRLTNRGGRMLVFLNVPKELPGLFNRGELTIEPRFTAPFAE